MKVFEIIMERDAPTPRQGWSSYCKNTPSSKMSAYFRNQCKSRGLLARDTGKTQKVGNKRIKLDGRRLASTKHGGPVSPTRTG